MCFTLDVLYRLRKSGLFDGYGLQPAGKRYHRAGVRPCAHPAGRLRARLHCSLNEYSLGDLRKVLPVRKAFQPSYLNPEARVFWRQTISAGFGFSRNRCLIRQFTVVSTLQRERKGSSYPALN